VLDAHSLYWYWRRSTNLGPSARAAFRQIELGQSIGIVPAIVVAEIVYAARKQGSDWSNSRVLTFIDAARGLRFEL